MKKQITSFRQLYQLMHSELDNVYQNLISTLAYTLSVKIEFEGKDDLGEDERLREDASLRVEDSGNILETLLSADLAPSVIESTLESSNIFTEELIEDILTIYQYRRENNNHHIPLFDEHDDDVEDLRDNSLFFYRRLLATYRVKAVLDEITVGMEEYGVGPYLLPEDSDDERDILEGTQVNKAVDRMTDRECVKEILLYLAPKYDDDNDTQADKKAILSLIQTLGSICRQGE